MDDNYNFPVALQPVYLKGGRVISGRKAVVRTDTNKPLGIVSDSYQLVKHGTVIDGFRKAAEVYKPQEEVTTTKDGAYLFYKMTFAKIEMEPMKGDIVRLQMIVRNSYNAMRSLQVVFGALRLVCLNGMVIGSQFLKFEYRHIGDMAGQNSPLTAEEYKNSISHYVKLFAENGPIISDMAKHEVKKSAGFFKNDYLHLPEYLRKESKATFDSGKDRSTWGYYNALTDSITHKMRKQNPGKEIKFGQKAWEAAVGTMMS